MVVEIQNCMTLLLLVLILIVLIGLFISFARKLGFFNPFQIYFSIWGLILTLYLVFLERFTPVPNEFLLTLIVVKIVAVVIVLSVRKAPSFKERNITEFSLRGNYLLVAQALTVASLPFAYQQAVRLAGGLDILGTEGYIQLRRSMTEEGQSFGVLGYFAILSYVVCSLRVYAGVRKKADGAWLALSVLAALSYVYFGTGRTGVLLLALLVGSPFFVSGRLGLKGVFVSLLLIFAAFAAIAALTAKGIYLDRGLQENISSYFENLASYTVAPLVAFSKLVSAGGEIEGGIHTFRFFLALGHAIGLISAPPVALVRDFVSVPVLTNVYTVYDVYFRDFYYFGLLVPPTFLMAHWYLYKKSKSKGGVWLFFYAASLYPLVMQFFQDQYFSLVSIWLQIVIFYSLFLRKQRFV